MTPIIIPHFLTNRFLVTHFVNPCYPVIFSRFYNLFPSILLFIFRHLTLFMSQHLSVHCANIFLVYSSTFIHLNLIFFTNILSVRFTTFHFYFPIFYSFFKKKTEKFRHFQTKFRQRGILKYLIFDSERDNSIYLFSYYLFLSLCFFSIFILHFLFVFIFIFVFLVFYFYLFILFMPYKVLVQFWSILVQGPYKCSTQGHFCPIIFNTTLIGPYLYPSNHWPFFLHTHIPRTGR